MLVDINDKVMLRITYTIAVRAVANSKCSAGNIRTI